MTLLWPATRFEVAELARQLRASDREEITFNADRFGRWHPGWTVERDVLDMPDHRIWAMHHRDGLIGLCGVCPDPQAPRRGAIWFLGTPLADRYWQAMTRASRRFIAMQAPHWEWMGNVVPAHMKNRIRWLERLGFDIFGEQAQQHGHVVFSYRIQRRPQRRSCGPF